VIDAIRSEWIKVSTVTVTWVLAMVAVAFPLVVTILTTALADSTWDGEDLAGLVSGLVIVTSMLLGVVATIAVTNEFAHNTIRPTFAAMPDRLRPLLAKPIVQVGITSVLTVVTVGACWLLGAALSGDSPDLGEGTALPSLVGVVLLAVGLTLLGFGLGLLIRNSPAAICVLLLWPLIAEGLIAGLLSVIGADGAVKFLPYSAGFNMALTDPDPDALGRVAGGVYFFAWVVVIGVLGIVTARSRDA
jgi:ABC-2 type transport system permease protein